MNNKLSYLNIFLVPKYLFLKMNYMKTKTISRCLIFYMKTKELKLKERKMLTNLLKR